MFLQQPERKYNMSEYIRVNGKYYLVDERSYDTPPHIVIDPSLVIPDPSHPEWTYGYSNSSWPGRDKNAGFPPAAAVVYDIKAGIGGDLELNKDWEVFFDDSPGMNVKFRWQYRVDSGTPTTEVGMAMYCNKTPINNANYDAFWTNPGGGALKHGLKIAVLRHHPANATSEKNAFGVVLWTSDYFSNESAKYVRLFAGTAINYNNITTGGQLYGKKRAPTTPTKDGDEDEGGLPTPPKIDPVGLPTLPNITVSGSGIRLTNPSTEEVKAFNNFLWSNSFADNILKIQQDPMQAVCGLYLTDCPLPTTDRQQIVCGNVDTGVSAAAITQMFTTVDCGSITLAEEYGSYLDYSPFKEAQLYLPHIGFVEIDNDIVQNNTIHIVYYVCLLDGQGLCCIEIRQNRYPEFSEVYKTYPCSVYSQIPLSAYDSTAKTQAYVNTIMSSAISLATKGGAAAAVSAIGGGVDTALTKNHVQQSGRLSDMAGLMGMKSPALIIYSTPAYIPEGFRDNVGNKIGTWAYLNALGGFSVVRYPQITFRCPEWVERDIKEKLQGGVYYL